MAEERLNGCRGALRIQKVDPPEGPIVYTIGALESRIGGSTFWILPGVWVRATEDISGKPTGHGSHAKVSENQEP